MSYEIIALKKTDKSFIFLAIGPFKLKLLKGILVGPCAMSPGVGLSPTTPFQLAGFLRLPPKSVPVANHAIPEANAAPDPPELPPADNSRFQGFFVVPNTSLNVLEPAANSGVFVLPKIIPPFFSILVTRISDVLEILFSYNFEPKVVLTPQPQ